jgi:hypothetical protein
MITFVCNRGEYPIRDLKLFTRNTGVRVVVRRYAEIIDGRVRRLCAT